MPVTLTVCLPDEAKERFEEMRQITGCKTDEAILRNAIALYECLVRELLVGGTILLQDAHGGQLREV